MKSQIQLFDEKKVRTVWDEENEEWYFSIVDVVEVLTDTDRPRKYWNDLKKKLKSGIKKESHITNALAHKNSNFFLLVDIKGFYPSTTKPKIKKQLKRIVVG